MTVAPSPAAAPSFNRAEWASAFQNVERELSQVPLSAARVLTTDFDGKVALVEARP